LLALLANKLQQHDGTMPRHDAASADGRRAVQIKPGASKQQRTTTFMFMLMLSAYLPA
jgi:hypothetical protein